jgi:hypothetical protein
MRRLPSCSFSSMENERSVGLFCRCRPSRDFLRWAGKTVKRSVDEAVGREGWGRHGKERCRKDLHARRKFDIKTLPQSPLQLFIFAFSPISHVLSITTCVRGALPRAFC